MIHTFVGDYGHSTHTKPQIALRLVLVKMINPKRIQSVKGRENGRPYTNTQFPRACIQ